MFYLAVSACGDSPGPQPGVCRTNVKGDGECDDYNNNEKCQWDGGDCCGANVKKNYCDKCECLDPSQKCCTEFNIKDSSYFNNLDFKPNGKLNDKQSIRLDIIILTFGLALNMQQENGLLKYLSIMENHTT